MTDNTDGTTVVAGSIHSDSASTLSRRSSSQASHASSESRRLKAQRSTTKKNVTKSAPKIDTKEDPSLTSFPSLSLEPEQSARPNIAEQSKPTRTVSQKLRARKATLAGLTGGLPLTDRSNALFDDSPRPSLDIPGSLHLSGDEHIERLIARVGAVKLIRQYAQDLAQRDAEISTLRVRADERERELKRLLREADIPSADVEKRLSRLEKTVISTDLSPNSTPNSKRGSALSINSMMNEAISDLRSADALEPTSHATVVLPDPPPTLSRGSKSSLSVSQLSNENITSQNAGQASTLADGEIEDVDSTIRPRQSSSNTSKVSGLQNIFAPPSNTNSYFIGGSNKTIKKGKALDEVSIRSNQSAKSNTSWTRIFGGRAQPSRSRASSIDQTNATKQDDGLTVVNNKVRATVNKPTTSTTSVKSRPQAQRSVTATRLSSSPNHTRKESNASSLPPTVELDSMIESSQLPPTMANHNTNGLLLDRFGFIYDRRRKRQQHRANKHTKQKPSIAESLANFRSGERVATSDQARRPMTPASFDDDPTKKSWQDYLLPTTGPNSRRPRELLAHTPSAGAVVTVSTAGAEGTITPPRFRDISITIPSAVQQALPAAVSVVEAQSSTTTATSAEVSQDTDEDSNEIGASKALLEQLTELHDNLQAERTVKWNDFLRRVRAERSSTSTERTANNAPEADLVNGELVGIATLGRSSKTKAKYMHFKSLVLAGIPVSLRPKIWAECSGASSLRVPGYYDDLVARSESDEEIEADIAQQIRADVKRTLRDNVFFRDPDAPGVQRLEELLRVYSLHNPRIGYCQGMNLITASLLLICATSEDCFWLLVVIIDCILPSGYFDQSLLVARADQLVLRGYVAEVLPKLDAKLQDLGVELEACTFHWFLSLYTGVLTGGEALYRIWDVVLCLNSSDSAPLALQNKSTAASLGVEGYLQNLPSNTPTTPSMPAGSLDQTAKGDGHDGTSSPFLFQLSLALLKLNEEAILALESPAQVYTYLNHNMTAHNITIDALVNASEMLRSRIKRSDVLERRKKAVESLE